MTLQSLASESDLQTFVVDYARLNGWLVHHTRPARTSQGWKTPIQGDAGYPDLTLARNGTVIFAELKSQRGRVRPEQQAWIDHIGVCHVWRPEDIEEIKRVLAR